MMDKEKKEQLEQKDQGQKETIPDKKKKQITEPESELTEYQKSTYISSESFEDIRKTNKEIKGEIQKWNNGIHNPHNG